MLSSGSAVRLAALRLFEWVTRRRWMLGRVTLGNILVRLLRLDSSVVTKGVGGLVIELDLADEQCRYVFFNAYERNEIRLVRRLVRQGDTVIDVGAHVGYLAAEMAVSASPGGRVHAIEADPENFERLNVLVRSSGGTVAAWWYAVVGPEVNADHVLLRHHPRHSMWSDIVPPDPVGDTNPTRVPVTTLPRFVNERSLKRVDFIKIDVEGAELGVLRGLHELVRRGHRPTILCELKPDVSGLSELSPLQARGLLLLDAGYELSAIDPKPRPIPVDRLLHFRGTLNVLLTPRPFSAMRAGRC